jgi:hypothetical protein
VRCAPKTKGRHLPADRCTTLDRGSIRYGLWNAINAAGSSSVCRPSDRTLATVRHVDELSDADRDASVISDEIVDLGWKAKHRTRPDHPVRLICVAVKPHERFLRQAQRRGDPGILRRRSHGLIGTRGSMLRSPAMNSASWPQPASLTRGRLPDARTAPGRRLTYPASAVPTRIARADGAAA